MSEQPIAVDEGGPAAETFQLEKLAYTSDPEFLSPFLDTVLADAYSTILLNPNANKTSSTTTRDKPSRSARPSSTQKSNTLKRKFRLSVRAETFNLLDANRVLMRDLLNHLFWIVHLTLHRPTDTQILDSLLGIVGRRWGHFLFPFETDVTVDGRIRDLFVDCVPYFMTQCIHHMFVLLSHLPETTMRQFRMQVCAQLVKLFTMIEPLESLLQSKLASYFQRPPQVEFEAATPMVKASEARTLLPAEDVRTLIEIPRRKRPRSSVWSTSGISTLISTSTQRKMVPFEHNSSIVVQYPKDGESDWTTELPPLLPTEMPARQSLTFANYEPEKDSRSLLYRSRRPALCDDYWRMKHEFEAANAEAREKVRRGESAFHEMKEIARRSPLGVLKRYCEDIRVLQLERKWTESPEWYTEQDLAEMEEQRLLRERQIQQDIEERMASRKKKKEPRLLPFEIEEMEQRKRKQSEEVPIERIPTGQMSAKRRRRRSPEGLDSVKHRSHKPV